MKNEVWALMKMTAIRWVLALSQLFKPVLFFLFSRSLLKKIKTHIMKSANKNFDTHAIKPFHRGNHPDGINLIGPLLGITGLGQSCRLVAAAIEAAGIPAALYNYHPLNTQSLTDNTWHGKLTKQTPYNINILHINAYELPLALIQLGNGLRDNRYNIAFWLWESEDFPEEWLPSLHLIDEIWVPSDFSGIAVKKHTAKPVITLPYPMEEMPVKNEYNRAYFNLPLDCFLFMCSYDSASVQYRKNPQGVINAFKQMLALSDYPADCGLIIKVGHASENEITALKDALSAVRNVFFIEDMLSGAEFNSLLHCADVYVSLHRAEGFGLVCAEAMLLGKPVIATNWSANIEFMTPASACLVTYTMQPLDKDYGPFAKGTMWAEPDINHVVSYMLRLYEDKVYYDEIGQAAKEHIKQSLNKDKISGMIKIRINEILTSQGGTP